MLQWLQDRWQILRSFENPIPFLALGLFQIGFLLVVVFPPTGAAAPLLAWMAALPWYIWIIGWLLVLWLSTLRYSVDRKKRFDETSANFFKAYLEFLVKDGHQLFHREGEKDYYSKVYDWQRKAIQGIAIGLGPKESEDFFQKVDSKSPLSAAYRESAASGSNEPLSRALQVRLEELNAIRLGLPEKEDEGKKERALENAGTREKVPVQPAGLLTGEMENPPTRRLPPK